MYPFLMRERVFPVKRISYTEDITPKELDQAIEKNGVIAHVTIRTKRDEYPYRVRDHIQFPLGQFTTYLTGPELCQLRSDGEVIKVHAAAVYKLGTALRAAAEKLLSAREHFAGVDSADVSSFGKALSVSLAGKLAQKGGAWKREPRMDEPKAWGEWWDEDLVSGVNTRYRRVCGLAFRYEPDRDGRGPHTAAFSYLAAYGRLMMRQIRDTFPPRSVVSQDTDGIWVFARHIAGRADIRDKDEAAPGELCEKGRGCNARFYSPRHYCIDGQWTLSGFHNHHMDDDGKHIIDTFNPLPWLGYLSEAPTVVHEVTRRSMLKVDAYGGRVLKDGWILPRTAIPWKEESEYRSL